MRSFPCILIVTGCHSAATRSGAGLFEPRLGERIDVHSLNAVGVRLYKAHVGPITIVSEAELRIVEGAGHSLYDPGIRDAVMKAIADLASKLTA